MSDFQMRTTKPRNNKFYQTRSVGGYSQCIQGYPTDRHANVLSNCVGYACGRFNEIIGEMKHPQLNCNAEDFIHRAKSLGLEISQKPTLGGIMVWQQGQLWSGRDGAGHVEVVERIDNDNQILTSASDYAGPAFYTAIRRNNNGRWGMRSGYKFIGCIVNPSSSVKATRKKKTVADIAQEVLQGKWGNGENRKERLTNAGYSYDEVQAEVNRRVSGDKPKAKKTTEQLVDEVLQGLHGNGDARKQSLGSRYDEVQKAVNARLNAKPRKSTAELAREVLDGKHGNGEARRKSLGDRYDEVQAEVNRLLGY